MSNYLKEGTNTVRVLLPHRPRSDLLDVTTWLVHTFGDPGPDTWIRYLDNNVHELGNDWWCYEFRDPENAALFALRWS